MVPFNLSKRGVDPYQLALDVGMGKRKACSCVTPLPKIYGLAGYGLSGLGFNLPGAVTDVYQAGSTGSVLDAVQTGLNFVPGVGTMASSAMSTFRQALDTLEQWFHIGAGRNEADAIVPLQNRMMDNLGIITNQILTGSTPSIAQLVDFYVEVWQLALGFMEFVSQDVFVDRRASGQALNTVMPYIDGTCGYAEPLGQAPYPGQRNCLTWGDGTVGGPGTDGMLGAIGRGIEALGGTVPDLGNLAQQAGTGVPPEEIEAPILPRITNWFASGSAAPILLGGLLLFGLAKNRRLFSRAKAESSL